MDPRYGDMSGHRVSMLGSSLRRVEDPEQSPDPRVRELVDALRTVDYAPAPSPRFRAELRAQLVAVAPRIIAESTPEAEPATARGSTVRVGEPLSAQVRRRRFVRPMAVAAGVAAAFLMLFGGAVWQSQKSLPGDSLYGLKRASENVRLAMSSGGADRGHEYLSLAQTRVEEARALLRRDSASAAGSGVLAGGLSTHTAQLIASNLSAADSDVTRGSDLLNTQAVSAKSQSPITVITGWAPGQLNRLHDLLVSLPQGRLQTRTKTSWLLTNSALTRARTLEPALAKGCASTTKRDPLGPLPGCRSAARSSTPAPPAPASTRVSTPPASTPAGTGVSGSSRTGAAPSGGSTPATSSPTTPTPTDPSTPAPPVLPPLLPSIPVSVGSCGISVSLGPVGLGVGGCPSHS